MPFTMRTQWLEIGEKQPLLKLLRNKTLYFFNTERGGEKTADFLINVPNKSSALKLNVRNTSDKYGNGSIAKIYINGILLHSLDCVKDKVRDLDTHEWIIPIGAMAGQNILVSIASNGKDENNADMQWMSIPELVKDDAQKLSDNIVKKETNETISPQKAP